MIKKGDSVKYIGEANLLFTPGKRYLVLNVNPMLLKVEIRNYHEKYMWWYRDKFTLLDNKYEEGII